MDFSALAAYNPNSEIQRPYVKFELRSTEDRTQTSPDGTCQMIDVAWVIVRAPGSKDSLEKTAVDWLNQLKSYAKDGRVPPSWHGEYAHAFALWQKGEEIPVNGTPIKTWPPLTPSQRKNILSAGILTIEDLALANDEVRGQIGMGGHGLVQMAQKWLKESKESGATAKALAAALVSVESLEQTVKNQAEQLEELRKEMVSRATAKPILKVA
jgi:hypothetical protein